MGTDRIRVIEKEDGENKIFFDERIFVLDPERTKYECAGKIMSGKLSGFDLTRMDYGEISLFYNPLRQGSKKAAEATKEIRDFVEATRKL